MTSVPLRTAITLVLLCALVGGVFAASLRDPVYRSEGSVRVGTSSAGSSSMPGLPLEQELCPWRKGTATIQAQFLRSPRAAEMAMRRPVWVETAEPAGADAVADFETSREVVSDPETNAVRVAFEHSRPEVAQAGVRALLETYEHLAREADRIDQRLLYARGQVHSLPDRIEELTKKILGITAEYGGAEALGVLHRAAVEQVLGAERDPEREGLEALRKRAREIGEIRMQVDRLQREREKALATLDAARTLVKQRDEAYAGRHVVEERGTLPTTPYRTVRSGATGWGVVLGALFGLFFAAFLGRRDA